MWCSIKEIYPHFLSYGQQFVWTYTFEDHCAVMLKQSIHLNVLRNTPKSLHVPFLAVQWISIKGVVKAQFKKQTNMSYLRCAVGYAQRGPNPPLLGFLRCSPGSSSSRVPGWRSALLHGHPCKRVPVSCFCVYWHRKQDCAPCHWTWLTTAGANGRAAINLSILD